MAEELEAKYGLPRDVRFCSRCVISNQRPNSAVEFKHTIESKKDTIHFDAEGVCDACRLAEKKKKIDWKSRDKELREVLDRFRRKDGRYDCIVPGSGGKDSILAAHRIKYEYGMHPLTITWAPHIYTDWGWKNHQAWLHAGFDNVLFTPNGRIHRLLTRCAVENIFHPFQPFILGQKNLAPQLSALYDIPLVLFGEHEAEYGNPIADASAKTRDPRYFSVEDHDKLFFGGVNVRQLMEEYGVQRYELEPYLPLDPNKLAEKKTEVHYLGYYWKWHPQGAYYYSMEHTGFQPSPERTPGTYSKYNSIDDKMDDLHYYTTFIKFGIGRATYDASQEIRSGDIDRDEGVALVRKFDGEYPARFEKELFEYLSIRESEFGKQISSKFRQPVMTREYFDKLCDEFRSPHLWKRENGQWKLRHSVFNP
jgi:N-acetyl sugar amidotransferase